MGAIAKEGRTILFVSHNLEAINRLCPTSVFLDGGRVGSAGATAGVVKDYLTSVTERAGEKCWPSTEGKTWGDRPASEGNDAFRPLALRVINPAGESVSYLRSTEPFTVEFTYELGVAIQGLRVQLLLFNQNGTLLLPSFDVDDLTLYHRFSLREPGRYVSRCRLPANLLAGGHYVFGVSAGTFGARHYFRDDSILFVEVDSTNGVGAQWNDETAPVFRMPLEWEIVRCAQ
jgi:lipopolysaccharide transport system ATP-binding protein